MILDQLAKRGAAGPPHGDCPSWKAARTRGGMSRPQPATRLRQSTYSTTGCYPHPTAMAYAKCGGAAAITAKPLYASQKPGSSSREH
jgi:hypothetical protein